MIVRSSSSSASCRRLLLVSASLAALAATGLPNAAHAQRSVSAVLGQQATTRTATTTSTTTPARSTSMQAALQRQKTTQERVDQIRAYATQIRAAADRGTVADGLDENGLDPTQIIKDALAAVKAGDTTRANELLISAGASYDLTGIATWEGAGLPSQTTDTSGHVTVTIDQTQERALLSWNRFDIGANTSLVFNQKENGVAQTDWTVVNRVTNATDPTRILGNMTADGTVVVINQAGIIFGTNSQVNLHSLLASTLELGNAIRFSSSDTGSTKVEAMTIADRNAAYLESGLFAAGNGTLSQDITTDADGPGVLVSAQVEGTYNYPSVVQFVEGTEGSVVVDSGAQISSGSGGFLILAAPEIQVDGNLTAVDGQVSLQAGRLIAFAESTGADASLDPYVRGYKLNSLTYSSTVDAASMGSILVTGAITSTRGYLSLGTHELGQIEMDGYLEATTSVSRNGKIALLSGNITLGGSANEGQASGIVILADDNGETIPQGTEAEPATFKSSQIVIATQTKSTIGDTKSLFDVTAPTNFTMGENAVIYAPGADVTVGATRVGETDPTILARTGSVEISSGALIDVSGLKDVQLDASRNSIEINPVKGNELRDTPNYREVVIDDSFTLNGATLYVDPRISGVRDDGVAWIGSPLIEAGSLAGQILATAPEFMTTGGTVSLNAGIPTDLTGVTLANAPSVHIAQGATIDVSGGWVTYAAGTVKTSRLITADGRIVDISQADPNEIYVGVVNSTTEVLQPRLGLVANYLTTQSAGQRTDAAYDEGRDAGAITISGAAVSIDGTIYGNAYAGSRQIASGDLPSAASTIAGDLRSVQATPYELPSGAMLSITSLGDVLVYHGTRGTEESDWSELLLSDTMLSDAGLSQLSLVVSGAVTFAGLDPETLQSDEALTITGVSDLTLASGGILTVDAGRTIRFDGNITIASGTIEASTTFNGAGVSGLSDGVSNGSLFRTGLYGEGDGDDISTNYLYAENPGDINPFDIVVTGTLSTAGRWVNDYKETGILQGGAWRDGGSISLTVAPSVFVAIGESLATATQAADLSGSIRVNGTLDVSAGGYVTSTGSFVLDGQGGDVSLVNETVYASTEFTNNQRIDPDSASDVPVNGTNQSVEFTSIAGGSSDKAVLASLVPTPSSTVDVADATITGYGFAGGGTFTLVAPDVSFGSDNSAGSTHIGLDFFKTTGFGTLDVSTYRSRIVEDLFANGKVSNSAFLETTQFVIQNGETLDLTQWMLPTILTVSQSQALKQLATGANLLSQSFLAPTTNEYLWDRKAANLVLGGLTELDVMAGGSIIGAPEASITVSKLYNAGSIVLNSGTITQVNNLVEGLVATGLGVTDTDLGGNGLADAFGGETDEEGRFVETAVNAAGITDGNGDLLTNGELVSLTGYDRIVYFLGLVGQEDGVVLAAGSTTDLSGVALYNPRTQLLASGARKREGRVVAGGSLILSSGTLVGRGFGSGSSVSREARLIRDDAAALDISGASGTYDQVTSSGAYASYLEWSAAGTISALGGGTLGTTAINASGGVEQAEGGTLEWLTPTVGSGDGSAMDYLSAAMIAASGFDTLIARQSLTLDGDFDLSLRKALMVTSRDPENAGNLYDSDARVTVSATEGTDARVSAGYIRFASRVGQSSTVNDANAGADADVLLYAGAQGIDVVGGIGFTESIGSLTLATSGDLRLTGVNTRSDGFTPTYDGQLIAAGDMLLDAYRVYATTGTGNYQAVLEGLDADLSKPFDIAVKGDHSITFGNTYVDPDASAPLSAGTYVRVLAARIVQNGYLAAPLGLLELGSTNPSASLANPTESITLGAGSVTTVSGAGLTVPYGTTTDAIEYYFPTLATPLTQLPVGELVLTADSIVQEEGALIDGRGGGDVYAYEFQSGTGGSRDVLSRYNSDVYSANNYDATTGTGYQYPDERQVYALVPVSEAGNLAYYDPLYSADYADLYGASAGKIVVLDDAPGVTGGEYLLVPAKYAISIPGALRVVENTNKNAPVPGTSTTLLDGSVIVGGTYAYAGTGIAESTRYSFTVQTKEVFTQYSSIVTTSGSDYLTGVAEDNGTSVPRLPLDAARVVLAPLTELKLAGAFDLEADEGGKAGQVDILGTNILVASDGTQVAEGVLLISDTTLAKIAAPSLLLGGRRSDNADGTTTITASAASLTIASDANLSAAELLLAVGGTGSTLRIEDGATLTATGDLGTETDADYLVSGAGSLLRLASGSERLVTRTGSGDATIAIGAATLTGDAMALDSSGSFLVADDAAITAKTAAISGAAIRFDGSADAVGQAGVIGTVLEGKLAAADQLTVRSAGSILFSAGTHSFNDLVLDTASLGSTLDTATDGAVALTAGDVRLLNSAASADGCATVGVCGTAGIFTLDATTISLGSGDVRAAGFTGSVALAASDGIYVEGEGSLSVGDVSLTLNAPFIAERSGVADPREQAIRPDYTFLTTGAVAISADGTNSAAEITGSAAPGAQIAFGTSDDKIASLSITGTTIRATSGIIDVQSEGDISLASATLSVPGYEQTFGDELDPVTVSAGGGTINLSSTNGSIATDTATTLITDTGTGSAGTLNLLASNGAITFDAVLNPDVEGAREGSLTFDSGTSSFDLSAFITNYGTLFGGDVSIRSGAGDLDLTEGQSLKAKSVALTADGGSITIAGTLDTSGVDVTGMSDDEARDADANGGDIELWGRSGVTLAATALLDTHTNGYADTDTRVASAGNVTIGIDSDSAAISIADGATIDVGARRTQADPGVGRLIPQEITDSTTGSVVTVYSYVEPDTGGTVTFRAPVIGASHDKVALSQLGTIVGADSVQLEAFQRYDLDALADSGLYTGITRTADGAISLDLSVTGANPLTTGFTLADGTSSLVQFIQDFDISTVDGSSLDGIRLRPGVELVSTGDIETATAWNLAAATFSTEQLQAAVAAGDLEVIPELSSAAGNPYYDGTDYYSVVAGREGDLLENYATFLYRVDGSAAGEAPVVTLRAGGDLTINASISDGFFTFRDYSDGAYINYQLGGGTRTYSPAFSFACPSSNCSNAVSYTGTTLPTSQTIVIQLSTAAQVGSQSDGAAAYVDAPLTLSGNGAAATGTALDADGNASGDPLGYAELFPLLSDGSAMHSSDIRLVAGADANLSVNPLHVDHSLAADMTVTGESSYLIKAVSSSRSYAGSLQFRLQGVASGTVVAFDIGDTLDTTTTTLNLNTLPDDAQTQINFGSSSTGAGADARRAALAWFAGRSDYLLVGSTSNPTGLVAPLNVIIAFLESFESTYLANLAAGKTGYSTASLGSPTSYGTTNTTYVRSYVRTGDGDIAVSAARDIDIRGTETAEYRTTTGALSTQAAYDSGTAGQFGAAAIYTAGVRSEAAVRSARVVDSGALVSLTMDSPYLTATASQVNYVPSPMDDHGISAVVAEGGGDVLLDAGRDVLGQHESWSDLAVDSPTQQWRAGSIGDDTEIGIIAGNFVSGVGALAGGDVTVKAGRDVQDLTIALTNSVTTTLASDGNKTMLTLGNGDLSVSAGRDILGGRYDIAAGTADIDAGRDITSYGTEAQNSTVPAYLRIRLSDAVVNVSALGSAELGSVSALGIFSTSLSNSSLTNWYSSENAAAAGFFSQIAALNLTANEDAAILETTSRYRIAYGEQAYFTANDEVTNRLPDAYVHVLPPTLNMTSILASVALPEAVRQILYPSPIGQLHLYSQGDISGLSLTMSDVDPGLLGGAFSLSQEVFPYTFPVVTGGTTRSDLVYQHNQNPTHADDDEPVRIYSNGDIDSTALFLPKQARITAAGDIVDMFFQGQNLTATDITRIRAGGDITGTLASDGVLPAVVSNNFILGGPGTLIVEAGGDLGPFMTSASIYGTVQGDLDTLYTYGGGIRTVGNDLNPWLSSQGADLEVSFGMAAGADYAALRDTYLDPANATMLDGDLFEQVTDSFGNEAPDRTKPIYAPILAEWLREHYPDLFEQVFGGESFADDAALATAAYGKMSELYAAFTTLDLLHQRDFLVNDLYFNELASVTDVDGPSYNQYIRGYRAVNILFPPERGYTDNLAAYTLDPSTVSEDHPLGEPTRNVVDGQPQVAEQAATGDLDLRLATIQTARGGDVTILGPGGDIIAGSLVRTSEQPSRRMTTFLVPRSDRLAGILSGSIVPSYYSTIASIPLGYEGILTLTGGQIRTFTDGDVILNQSRVFSQQTGDITMWSSNGDIAAGQGPKSAASFPAVTVRLDENGNAEVDSAGSVSGAGIGSFQRTVDDPPSDVLLIAPVGTVDAGDAGVRASGNVVVAAARVANADNFKAAGDITGVPNSTATNVVATPADAASAVAAQVSQAANSNNQTDRRSIITVDVIGPASDGRCDPNTNGDPDCR